MSRFAPVHLERGFDGRISQTALRHYSQCPRSAYLYQAFKGQQRTREMERGKALHSIIERAIRLGMEESEYIDLSGAARIDQVPPEVVKAICDEVLADPEFAVPIEEHDSLREMVYRWASEFGIEPSAVVACETLFVLDIGGYEVRAKVDYAQALEEGAAVYVADWKSSRSAPPFEEVARKRSDGTLAPKQFQLLLYALVLAYGVPVRIEECGDCGGNGMHEGRLDIDQGCERCGTFAKRGSGHVEIREPFPVASRAQRFDLEFVFPAIEDREEKMLRRSVSLTRLELDEYRASFEGLLARVRNSEGTGDWPAVVSDMACGECPASSMCPIPSELRDFRGEINTVEQASEAAEVLDRRAAEDTAIRKELKAFCKAHGISLRYGQKVWEFVSSSSVRVDRDGLIGAAKRAAQYGEPFDENDYMRVSNGTNFKARDLTADELAEEAAEGSNG